MPYGLQSLMTETVREDGYEVVEANLPERSDRLGDDTLDRLAGDDAVKLLGKVVHLLAQVSLGGRVEMRRHALTTYSTTAARRLCCGGFLVKG